MIDLSFFNEPLERIGQIQASLNELYKPIRNVETRAQRMVQPVYDFAGKISEAQDIFSYARSFPFGDISSQSSDRDPEVVTSTESSYNLAERNYWKSQVLIVQNSHRKTRQLAGTKRHEFTNSIKERVILPILASRSMEGINPHNTACKIHKKLSKTGFIGKDNTCNSEILQLSEDLSLDPVYLKSVIKHYSSEHDTFKALYQWCRKFYQNKNGDTLH